MSKWKLSMSLGLLLAVTALGACAPRLSGPDQPKASNSRGPADSNKVVTTTGDTAPDFDLALMDGSRLKLADLRGKPAVLIFWTAWCPICKEEAPQFNQLAAQFAPRGVRVIGINIRDSVARTEGGIKEFGIQYTVARDADASVARRYKVTGTPTVIFLDGNAVVRYFGNELPEDYPARLVAMLEQNKVRELE